MNSLSGSQWVILLVGILSIVGPFLFPLRPDDPEEKQLENTEIATTPQKPNLSVGAIAKILFVVAIVVVGLYASMRVDPWGTSANVVSLVILSPLVIFPLLNKRMRGKVAEKLNVAFVAYLLCFCLLIGLYCFYGLVTAFFADSIELVGDVAIPRAKYPILFWLSVFFAGWLAARMIYMCRGLVADYFRRGSHITRV